MIEFISVMSFVSLSAFLSILNISVAFKIYRRLKQKESLCFNLKKINGDVNVTDLEKQNKAAVIAQDGSTVVVSLADSTAGMPVAPEDGQYLAQGSSWSMVGSWAKTGVPAYQSQSDWKETDNTKPDFIKNKPTIPASQIQSDWSQADNTKVDFIKNKPTIPPAYTLPAANLTNLGGVKQAAKQNQVADGAQLADVIKAHNALIAALVASGALQTNQ